MKSGQQSRSSHIARNKVAADKDVIKTLETELTSLEKNRRKHFLLIPNVPHAKVPAGLTPEQNLNVHQHGNIPTQARMRCPLGAH